MKPRAKLVLVLAVAGGATALLVMRKRSAQAAALPEDSAPPSAVTPLPVQPFPVGDGFPVPAPSPGASLPIPLPPLPGDLIGPPIQLPEEDEREDIVLVPVAPPFVPPPAQNVAPVPAPAPAFPLPAPILPPELVNEIPGLIPTPVVGPGIPVVAPAPIVVQPPVIAPPIAAPPAEQPTVLEEDTAQLLGLMLGRESTSDWKRTEPLLKLWQGTRDLTADGKFGPGTALVMAQETGLLPIVRFWPQGSLIETGAVDNYREALFRIARTAEEPRRSQLMAAAEREQGQGFGRNPVPITPLISI